MASDRFGYCTRDEGFVGAISALLAAGFVRGFVRLPKNWHQKMRGAAPASLGASLKAIAQNSKLRRT